MECANGAGADACAGGDRSKVNDFSKQILQLAGIAFHQDEEKSRTEVLEKLKGCNKRMLVELCRSFDIPGSTSTKKDELVTMLMEFLMEHGSGIIYTDPDKVQVLSCQKLKKRKSYRSGANLSGAEPSKKRKPNGTVLETRVEEEADGRKAVEDRTNYSEFCLRDNRDEFTNNKTGIFAKEQAKPEPFEGVNDSSSGKLAVVPLPGVPILINEQKIITTPSAKLVCNVENDTMDMMASMKKNISVTKKKTTQNIDSKEKIGGKIMSRGDAKPRKQALKPSKDELRQAVFCILGAANFATMTFGEVVKAVDKYFGKDLFERKPLVRALIEEELFRLAKEAEKKELEEEAKEAKARAEQSAKDSAIDGRVESDIDKEYELQDGKSKDAEKSGNNNSTEKGAKSGVSWEADENRNRNAAAENLQDGEAEVDTRNKNNSDGFTKDFEAENIVQNANDDAGIENLRDGKAETANNCNGNIIGGSEDVKSGENDDTKDGRTEDTRNKNNSDGFTKDCEAENSVQNANGDAGIENLRDGKAETANNCNGNTIGGSEDVKSGENDDPKDGRTEATRNKNNSDGFTKDCEVENIVQNANGDAGIENFRDGKAETVNNCNGDAIGGSQDVKSVENNDTKDGRTEERWAENDAETVVDHGPEESKTNENVEHVNSPEAEDVKSEEARGNEITLSRGTNCGKTNEIIDNVITEAKRTEANDDGKAEDSEHSINTKIDVGSSDHGTCENGKTMDDAETKTTVKPKIQMC